MSETAAKQKKVDHPARAAEFIKDKERRDELTERYDHELVMLKRWIREAAGNRC